MKTMAIVSALSTNNCRTKSYARPPPPTRIHGAYLEEVCDEGQDAEHFSERPFPSE